MSTKVNFLLHFRWIVKLAFTALPFFHFHFPFFLLIECVSFFFRLFNLFCTVSGNNVSNFAICSTSKWRFRICRRHTRKFLKWNFMCNMLIVCPKQFISNLFFASLFRLQRWNSNKSNDDVIHHAGKSKRKILREKENNLKLSSSSRASDSKGVDSQQKRFNKFCEN